MFIPYLSFTPEFLLLVNVIVLQIVKLCRKEQTPKTFASISKILWFLGLLGSVVFYNISFDKTWYVNTEYTTFVKVILLGSVLLMNGLVCRWFLNQNYNSCRYYQLISVILIGLFGVLSSQHLGILTLSLSIVFVAVAMISDIGMDNIIEKIMLRKCAIINSLISIAIIVTGVLILYENTSVLQYDLLQTYYQKHAVGNLDTLGTILILTAILCLIGCIPFHFERLKMQRDSILPVATILSLILPITGIAFLLRNVSQIFGHEVQILNKMTLICGMLSVVGGAIGSGSRSNLRQILGCLEIFNIGIVLLLIYPIQNMKPEVVFIYSLLCLIISAGAYVCLYGGRSRGNYLQTLEDFSGLAEAKPYLSGFLLIFCCSFLGLPPFLGVLGNILTVNVMLSEKRFTCLGIIFLALIWVSYGILKIIKSLYFDRRTKNFERIDMSVYVGILLIILLIFCGLSYFETITENIEMMMRK